MLETAQDVLDLVRLQIDDRAEPYLWEDAELLKYLDHAQKEFARETHCFPDRRTFTLRVTADEPWLSKPERVIDVREAKLRTSKTQVFPCNANELSGYWEGDTGLPVRLITDLDVNYWRLYPIPTAADTLELFVTRLPEDDITDASGVIEIPDEWREALLEGVKARAYLKQDVETYDPEKANVAKVLWQQHLIEAAGRIRIQQRRPGVVRYGGI